MYVRYYMHKQLRNASSDLSHVIDVGVGIVSGGFGIEGQAIGIITPYNSQANLIRGAVPESVEIQTIDKYQINWLADIFRGKVVDISENTLTMEVTGDPGKMAAVQISASLASKNLQGLGRNFSKNSDVELRRVGSSCG